MFKYFYCIMLGYLCFFIVETSNFAQTTEVKWEKILTKEHVLDSSLEYSVWQAALN
mgnify:CR=1 FL=1